MRGIPTGQDWSRGWKGNHHSRSVGQGAEQRALAETSPQRRHVGGKLLKTFPFSLSSPAAASQLLRTLFRTPRASGFSPLPLLATLTLPDQPPPRAGARGSGPHVTLISGPLHLSGTGCRKVGVRAQLGDMQALSACGWRGCGPGGQPEGGQCPVVFCEGRLRSWPHVGHPGMKTETKTSTPRHPGDGQRFHLCGTCRISELHGIRADGTCWLHPRRSVSHS